MPTDYKTTTNVYKAIFYIVLDGWHLVGEVGKMNKEIVHEIY